MKKLIKIFVVLLISFSFNACDEAEDLLDVKIPASINENIIVQIDDTNSSWDTYSKSVLLSIDTGDIHKYINKIKDVKVNKLSYKIINFSGDPTGKVKGSFTIDNTNINLENEIVVKTEADKATVFEITNVDELNEIGEELKKNKRFTARYSGSALCDENMNFIIVITANITVIANPL